MKRIDSLVSLVLHAAEAGGDSIALEELRRELRALPGFVRVEIRALAVADVKRIVGDGLSVRSACASVARTRGLPLETVRTWARGLEAHPDSSGVPSTEINPGASVESEDSTKGTARWPR